MTENYRNFISFLNDNVQTDNELDMIIYNIGSVQKIAEQFSYFYNQQIKEEKIKDEIDFEVSFENEANEKIRLALGLGDEATWFVECNSNTSENTFVININKVLIAQLTLEAMRDDL